METELNLVLAILGVLLLLFFTVFALLVHAGLFTKFEIRAGKPPFDNILVAYRFARGPYKNAGNLFTEVHTLVPNVKTIGVYYDDPQEVSSSDLRFIVGAVLDDNNDEKSKENEKLLLEKGYKLITFPAVSHAITAAFPFKNTLSIFIAVSRVYPQLNEFIKVRSLCAHPMIEVYDKDTIVFIAPLARQDEFYVPEAKEEASDEERSTPKIQDISSHDGAKSKESLGLDTSTQQLLTSGNLSPNKSENGSPADDSAGSSFEELNMDS